MPNAYIIPLFTLLTIAIALFMIWRQLYALHLTLNSRLDELIRTTRELALAQGFAAGKENQLKQIREFEDK